MPIHHKLEKQLSFSHPSGGEPILAIDNLSFAYSDGRVALRSVSMEMAPGEKVALVGPNGAGKSTLLLQVNGLLDGDGAVHVAGLPLCEENLPLIHARVGMIFQNPDDQLFSPTVYEDVAFGPLHMGLPEDEIHARVQAALRKVGMAEHGERLSHHLSAGEKKRVSIATALAMQPQLLLLDEPTAGLDPRGRRQLIQLLNDMQVGMLVATHDLLLARDLLPRMAILDEGRLVAEGKTDELLRDEALLAAHGLELP